MQSRSHPVIYKLQESKQRKLHHDDMDVAVGKSDELSTASIGPNRHLHFCTLNLGALTAKPTTCNSFRRAQSTSHTTQLTFAQPTSFLLLEENLFLLIGLTGLLCSVAVSTFLEGKLATHQSEIIAFPMVGV
jgi:hypothetical protein